MLPIATYRLQLRNGVDFVRIETDLDAIARQGISHLHLSPIWMAASGSLHGYDVTRPDAVDPALGGIDGFRHLAAVARGKGLGLILDLVPGHTAFSPENPWLRDVLRHGQDSRYAGHFDIDWSAGRLVLPWLPRPLKMLRAEDAVRIVQDEQLGAVLQVGDLRLPLRGGADESLAAVLARQPWQLVPCEAGRDSITHRQFLNTPDLIAMRLDRAEVFDDMHRLVLALIATGDVQGLHVRHIDSLRAPGAYLAQLRARIGRDVPIWVEKTRVGSEPRPRWPVEGMTGHEQARNILQAMTPPDGVATLTALWSTATGRSIGYAETLKGARRDILWQDLPSGILQLIGRACDVLSNDPQHDPGPETLRQAVIGMLEGMPVYRTYFGDDAQEQGQDFAAQVITELRRHVCSHVRPPTTALRLIDCLAQAQTPAEIAFRDQFQQTSGMVFARPAEETALCRYLPFPAGCLAGASPDDIALTSDAFAQISASMQPGEMMQTVLHDCTRSEDARMRLVACAHLPDAVQRIWRELCALPRVRQAEAEGLRKDELWALMHTLLATWQPQADSPDLAGHVVADLQKTMRAAREISASSYPDVQAEAPVLALARDLVAHWQAGLPEAVTALFARAEVLSLVQLAVKCLSRGVPDICSGESSSFRLSGSGNRGRVAARQLALCDRAQGFAGRKVRLIRRLLTLRRERIADLRGPGEIQLEQVNDRYVIQRQTESGEICVEICAGREPVVHQEPPSLRGPVLSFLFETMPPDMRISGQVRLDRAG